MIRFIVFVVILCVVIVFAVNLTGHFWVSKVLEDVLNVPVKADRLQINPFAQEFGVYGLRIYNPKGFQEDLMASVPEVFVRFDFASVFQRKLRIRQIRFHLDQITVERDSAGRANLMELESFKRGSRKEPPKRPEVSGKPEENKTQPESGKRFSVQIDEAVVSIGRARYVDNSKDLPVVREFPLEIKDATFRNVTDPNQLVQQIVLRVMQQVSLNVLVPDFGPFATAFSAQAASKMEEIQAGLSSLFGEK